MDTELNGALPEKTTTDRPVGRGIDPCPVVQGESGTPRRTRVP